MNAGDINRGMNGSLNCLPGESAVIEVNSAETGYSTDGEGSAMVFGISTPSTEENAASAVRLEKDKRGAGIAKGKEEFVDVIVESSGEDKVCRICHLSPEIVEWAAVGWELIHIGCGCKGELGNAHRCCAEAWFRVKRNRYCEICGLNAKNVLGKEDSNSFMERWNEGRRSFRERVSCCNCKSFCHVLLYFLVGAFTFSWILKPKFF